MNACRQLGVEITPEHFSILCNYVNLVRDWNKHINLVSRQDTGRLLSYHVIDSLAVSQLIPKNARCCDIGTGAGLPGIPLAITRPDIQMILVESTKKKCHFLNKCLSALSLGSTVVINERAEALPPLNCDVILSRLTGPFRRVIRQTAHHARNGGLVIMFKNPAARNDLDGMLIDRLRLEILHTVELLLPVSGVPRRFVVLRRRQASLATS